MFGYSPQSYGWLMLAGIGLSLGVWIRLARRDDRLMLIYAAALAGAFVGAKLAYILAEGHLHWREPNRWIAFATGKSITGALLGGYGAVELAKYWVGYRTATGDRFAITAALGIGLGRIGCILHGCCLGKACHPSWFTMNDVDGVARWPAAGVELVFNFVILGVFLALRARRAMSTQHFHLYLMAYGAFRFCHELVRETPGLVGSLTGYQIAAACIFALGAVGYIRRRRAFLEVKAPLVQVN
jgi:phosphatidylglycerol:prolipoprotein diacylglycerol transferase